MDDPGRPRKVEGDFFPQAYWSQRSRRKRRAQIREQKRNFTRFGMNDRFAVYRPGIGVIPVHRDAAFHMCQRQIPDNF